MGTTVLVVIDIIHYSHNRLNNNYSFTHKFTYWFSVVRVPRPLPRPRTPSSMTEILVVNGTTFLGSTLDSTQSFREDIRLPPSRLEPHPP